MGAGVSASRGKMFQIASELQWDPKSAEFKDQIQQNEGVVSHFMPPTFPLEAFLDPTMMERCRHTWGLILDGTADGMKNNQDRAGIVLFYDEFFFRLFKRAKVFLDIFPEPGKRGEILMKAIGMMLHLEGDDSAAENRKLFYLGKMHRFKNKVRPWHFGVYLEVALETLMFWLGTDADLVTGESWTCLASYTLRRLLKAYLVDQVVPNEFYQNCEIGAIRKIMTQSTHSRMASRSGGASQYSQMSQHTSASVGDH